MSVFRKRKIVLPVHCLPGYTEDRRWIKPWMSDLLAAAVTLLRWITTHNLWPHLPESSPPQSGTEGVWCVNAHVCVRLRPLASCMLVTGWDHLINGLMNSPFHRWDELTLLCSLSVYKSPLYGLWTLCRRRRKRKTKQYNNRRFYERTNDCLQKVYLHLFSFQWVRR